MASRRTRSTRPACLSFLPGLLLPDELQTMVLEAAVTTTHCEGTHLSQDLTPLAMLALTNTQWADNLRELWLVPYLQRMQKLECVHRWLGLEKIVAATTLRMTPTMFVDWLVGLSNRKMDDEADASETNALQWLFQHYALNDQMGKAACRLRCVSSWTPELLVKATGLIVEDIEETYDDPGFAGQDVGGMVGPVAQKTRPCIGTLAIRTHLAKLTSASAKASFLLNLYGKFVDDTDFTMKGATMLGATAALLTRSGDVTPADMASLLQQLQTDELWTRRRMYEQRGFMCKTPFGWSRALLLAWAPAVGLKDWSRRDKRELNTAFSGWFRSCINDLFRDQEHVSFPRCFHAKAATSLASDLGTLAALALATDDAVALLSRFVERESAWREGVLLRGVGGQDVPSCWPDDSLTKHYAAHVLSAWARASGFPALASSDDCAKVAQELAGWPLSFREAASFVVLGWVADGNGSGDGAKLVNAVLHGGVKPPAKPKKK